MGKEPSDQSVYGSWAEIQHRVNYVSGAVHKSFKSRREAGNFIQKYNETGTGTQSERRWSSHRSATRVIYKQLNNGKHTHTKTHQNKETHKPEEEPCTTLSSDNTHPRQSTDNEERDESIQQRDEALNEWEKPKRNYCSSNRSCSKM